MRKMKLFAIACLIFWGIGVNAQDAKNYSTLHLLVDYGDYSEICHFDVYINDSMVGKISSLEYLQIALQQCGVYESYTVMLQV